MRVKICGLCDAEAVDAAVDAGADAVGFVLVPSPRRVSVAMAVVLAARLPDHVVPFAVLRDASEAAGIDLPPTFRVQAAGAECLERGLPVLVDGPDLPEQAAALAARGVTCALVDGPSPGSGRAPHPHHVHAASRHLDVVLAGGLAPETVGRAIQTFRPAGVDVSSGVERSRGVKDPIRIHAFVRAARAALEAL